MKANHSNSIQRNCSEETARYTHLYIRIYILPKMCYNFKCFILVIIISLHTVTSKLSRLNVTTERIVGGKDIPSGQFVPYQVSLQYLTSNNVQQHFCGGTIISTNHILTAAHCCDGLNVERMSIVAGLRELQNSSQGVRCRVMACQIHPNYVKLKTSDIAVIRIEPSLKLDNKSIGIIDIGDGHMVGSNVRVTLTGWGLRLPVQFPFVPDTFNYPKILQTMTYRTISNRQCIEKGLDDLTNTEICAQGFPLKGACSGDSGGPLVRSTKNGLQQVGVVSYGLFICGIFDVPDVYTRVSEFHDWLIEFIKT